MPNINFGDYQLKQNRFAKRVKKEGILLVHDSPSPASLKAIPEADFGRVKVRRNNYAERIKTQGARGKQEIRLRLLGLPSTRRPPPDETSSRCIRDRARSHAGLG